MLPVVPVPVPEEDVEEIIEGMIAAVVVGVTCEIGIDGVDRETIVEGTLEWEEDEEVEAGTEVLTTCVELPVAGMVD